MEPHNLKGLLALLPLLCAGDVLSQSAAVWQPNQVLVEEVQGRAIAPSTARFVDIERHAMERLLGGAAIGTAFDARSSATIIDLPMPDGGRRTFSIVRTEVLHPELQARFPGIITASGIDTDAPHVSVKLDITPHGFHAMVLGIDDPVFIDPVGPGSAVLHQVYNRSALVRAVDMPAAFCTYDEVNDLEAIAELRRQEGRAIGDARMGDCTARTYRLALACTGEYANFHGSNPSNNNKSFALAAMVTTMNRVNGVFEKELAITMQLVANNDLLVFLDPDTDDYTNNLGNTMLGQNITKCNAVIGSANYDIGHVFSTGGGGVAYLESVCGTSKAGGVTGRGQPVGDAFDIDYVAHEMGHQFGGNHTQNNNCNREPLASREVGSGITIMGYAGVCEPNVASNSIAMFGAYSLQEMHGFITRPSHSCPLETTLMNTPPTANAGVDRVIPRNTNFFLTGTGADADPANTLTYSWEQMDAQVVTQPPVLTNASGPAFRPFLPTTSPVRYIPELSAVVNNISPTWEVLSTVSRTYAFRLTVRDNAAGGGCIAQDNMVVTVNNATGPFRVTQPNTALNWPAGGTRTVTWNVNNTTQAPVSCSHVDILLSVDGGYTYPYTLLTATPNDGTQSVVLPNVSTTTARVMVRANGNIFYDISNEDFIISGGATVKVAAKAYLEGPYNGSTQLMNDALRAQPLFPLTEPYTALGYPQFSGGGSETIQASVLSVSGNNAIVDWVRVELRSSGAPGTIVASRQGLLQRDGDIVDVDGTSPLAFAVGAGNYHVAVRHRNHFGCMSASAMALGEVATTVDLTLAAFVAYGTDARKQSGTTRLLWAGNVVRDNQLKYTGTGSDRDPILTAIGGSAPTSEATGYRQEDCNLDGAVRYTGGANDRDIILQNIGGTVPTNNRIEQLP